ncbi:DgyrCDS10092 [Dimorphilus gyrociliatus]|uniref:DgyrCDS10092 n=1 Tax=Dimorphilus gyrociliatus TaxID=2664684 RepID=A0A7I8W0E2_9ANNE|nr:DgyrCDS10092 [Dimorphilus gyrociliatus]
MPDKKLSYLESMQRHFENYSKTKEYPVHSAKVHSVDWSCTGNRLASGSFDKTCCLFTVDKDRLIKDQILRGHDASVDQLCWHPSNPDNLATASGDKTVRIWDARSGQCVQVFKTKGENINICWSPNGQYIAVGNKEDLLTFCDLKAKKIRKEEQFRSEVNEISWSPNGDFFYVTSGSGHLNIYSYPNLKLTHSQPAHCGSSICITFDKYNKHMALGGADALVSVWDVAELACLNTITRLSWPVRSLSFSHDGKLLASASEDHFIDIAEIPSGEKVTQIKCENSTFTLKWHPKEYLLAYACDDKDRYDRDAGSVKLFGLLRDSSDKSSS